MLFYAGSKTGVGLNFQNLRPCKMERTQNPFPSRQSRYVSQVLSCVALEVVMSNLNLVISSWFEDLFWACRATSLVELVGQV